jgi:multicomponent Na+:H+ antiporter subunit E
VTFALYLIGVTVMWVLAWGSLSVANVISGMAVAGVLLVVAPDGLGWLRGISFRPIAVIRFTLYAIGEIAKANVVLIRSIVARQTNIHTGVMAVPLPECSDALLTIVTNVIALTPGTSPLHITRYPTVLYVHVLDMRDPAATRRDVQRLAGLAFDAFGPEVVDLPRPDDSPEDGLP